MLGHTHALFGVTTLALAQAASAPLLKMMGLAGAPAAGFIQAHPAFGGIPAGPAFCLGAAILGALVPDLDAEDSTIQRDLGGVGKLTQVGLQLLGVEHRGVLHSGLAATVAMVAATLLGWRFGYTDVGLAFGLGYLSHVILADAMTLSGVPLLWPSARRFHLLPRRLRVRTGGLVETLVFIAVAAVLVWLSPMLVPANLLKVWTHLI